MLPLRRALRLGKKRAPRAPLGLGDDLHMHQRFSLHELFACDSAAAGYQVSQEIAPADLDVETPQDPIVSPPIGHSLRAGHFRYPILALQLVDLIQAQ